MKLNEMKYFFALIKLAKKTCCGVLLKKEKYNIEKVKVNTKR